MQKKKNSKNLKNVDKKKLETNDSFMGILWRKEVESKINI